MKHIVLGTAGHIDHGKTALIKALTGVDTDRLKEEKERGISIDLGFAYLDLPGGVRAGIVDVPGHERFIKNMLAGTCGIDAVLLVVAANEGVMPQTREHLAVVNLLKIERGVIALTKTDLVDAEWLDLVRSEVEALKGSSALRDAEVVPVSSVTGEGLGELVAVLDRLALSVPERSSTGPVRLPIDRVFTVEGFGTVVTGTLWSGEVKEGDHLHLLPEDVEVRVRSVQVHSQAVEKAAAGQRTAVALHGLGRAEPVRGDVVVTPGAFASAHMLDARVELTPDAPRAVKNRTRLRLHLGASEVLCRAVLLEGEVLPPGASGLAQLRLESPVVAARGDRFVLRSYSPMRVIGGGGVLDPHPVKHRAGDAALLDRLRVLETGTPEDRVLELLAVAAERGQSAGDIARAMGEEAAHVRAMLSALGAAGRALAVSGKLWVHAGAVDALGREMVSACEDFQKKNPVRWGMSKEELRNRAGRRAPGSVFEKALESLVAGGRLFARADRVRAGNAEISLPPGKQALRTRIASLVREKRFSPPLVSELKDLFPDLGAKPAEFLDTLVDLGDLVKVSPVLYLDPGAVAEARRLLVGFFGEHERLTVPEFKTLLGITRKYTIPLLEHFDVTGVTQRVGDERVAGVKLRDAGSV